MLYSLKGFEKCYSDLFRDGDERRCFQCGRVYHPKRSPMELQMGAEDFEQAETASGAEPGHKRPKIRRSARHLNSVPAATRFNEEQWRAKSENTRDLSEIVGQGPDRSA